MSNDNSGTNVLVGIVAIVVIVFIGWYAIQILNQEQNDDVIPIDVNLNGTAGGESPQQ